MLPILLRLALACCAWPPLALFRLPKPLRTLVFAPVPILTRKACRIAWGEIRTRLGAKFRMVPA